MQACKLPYIPKPQPQTSYSNDVSLPFYVRAARTYAVKRRNGPKEERF